MLEMISIPLLNRILLFFYSLCRVTIRTQFQTYFWVSRKFLIQLWGQKGGEGWPPPLPLARPVSTNAIHCLQGDDN